MLNKTALLDLIENFILFDDSRAGGTRKVVARNHQVLGVNNAVASVLHQEELKRQEKQQRFEPKAHTNGHAHPHTNGQTNGSVNGSSPTHA